MNLEKLLSSITNFVWDEHNFKKNWSKHRVSTKECEELFTDPNLRYALKTVRPSKEERWAVMGKTKQDRELLVVFTLRQSGIRVISARPLSRKERRQYDETETDSNL